VPLMACDWAKAPDAQTRIRSNARIGRTRMTESSSVSQVYNPDFE
jgi:hypothetical protein